jgi:hypothetical protein
LAGPGDPHEPGRRLELETNLYTGVKTPGACKNDILVSVSSNGGASFTGTLADPRMLTSAAPKSAQLEQTHGR